MALRALALLVPCLSCTAPDQTTSGEDPREEEFEAAGSACAQQVYAASLIGRNQRAPLRAENFSRGAGRLYTIKYAAPDASGNTNPRVLTVRVQP